MKIDGYMFHARIMPSIIFFIPLIVELNFLLARFKFELQTFVFSNVILLGILVLFSHFVRYLGRKREKMLFKKWNGAPTTRFLRFNNTEYNENLKKAVRDAIEKICSCKLPTKSQENAAPDKADKLYSARIAEIRGETRDEKKYKLLNLENAFYGFWRNLYAIKIFSIFIVLGLIITNICFLIFLQSVFTVYNTLGILIFLLIWFILLLTIVSENKVKDIANIYAERLFECILKISKEESKYNERNDKKAN